MPNKIQACRALGAIALITLPAFAWTPPTFSRLDSLFLTAATGAPRFQARREAAEKALLAEASTLDYLVEKRLRGQTPRQQHYVERVFTVLSDSGRDPRPRETLSRALSAAANDTVRAQLLYIGSRIGDSAFRDAAIPWLRASAEPVRRMAMRSLGAYPRPAHLPRILQGLDSTHGLELHQRLWALDAQGPLRAWRPLVPLLEEAHAFNRRKVRDMLLKATDSSWAVLQAALPAKRSPAARREWRLLAQDAKGGQVFLEAESAGMTEAERIFFGVEEQAAGGRR
jgi:hypothetical protein